jgi:BirA family biotin operon repressor/biotin-[acetyl-CoA-carboxylase] ligase
MDFALASEAAAAGYSLVAHDTIGSTNTDALERLRGGEAGPLWVVSRRQSDGRGRRGSAWQSEAGNLAASLALITRAEPAMVATLGFVAGVALVRALDRCCASFEAGLRPALQDEGGGSFQQGPHAEVRASASLEARTTFHLKWPNDVLADGAKLAGILLESEIVAGSRAVVIGIGVNVTHAPEGLAYPAASLQELGVEVTAADLFASLSAEWLQAFALWDEGRGFVAVRDLWLARAAGIGRAVSVRSGPTLTSGTFDTIDEHGRLVLRTGEGAVRTVSAGEVHFGSAASARQEAAA